MPPDNSRGYADSKPSKPMRSMAASDRLRISARDMRCASSPSATFSKTVSQGNKAKLWNTMAMPGAGPRIGLPRYCNSPALGSASPAIKRNKVDLPEPDRPKRPTICPSRNSRFIPCNTNSSAPSGFGNALRTSVHCSRGELFMPNPSGKPIFTLGVVIQGAPEEPIDHDHEKAHGADPQHDLVKVSCRGRLGNVGTQAPRLDLRVPPSR